MRRIASTFLLLALPAACHRADSAPTPSSLPPDTGSPFTSIESGDPSIVSESPEARSQIEPALAVTADGAVAIAWTNIRADQGTTIGARFSPDRGASWGPVQTIVSPDDRAASDPVLVTDRAGNIYLGWLGTGANAPGGAPDSHLYLARSAAGTGTLEAPLELTDTMHRGSKISSPGLAITAAGAIVATWAYASPVGDGIGIARSTDGVRWIKGVVIERIDLHASLPHVCASASGDRVWVAYLDSEAGVRLRSSDDGGATWSTSRVTTVSKPEERLLVAADSPVCTGDAGNVTVAYGRVKDRASTAIDTISVAKSYDGGRTFDARRTLDTGSASMLDPQLARESDGALDLAFYASGATPEAGSLRWVRAGDDTSQLGAPRVARDHFRFEPSPTERAWPGKSFGWAWHDGTVYAASIDNSGDLPHVAFTRLPSR